jgi:hypothetical protein
MNKYLLLRDNKESGPYSLDQIRVLNLQQYDLVWIEGQSLVWKYPSEIHELKSFVPAAESSLASFIHARKESQMAYFSRNYEDLFCKELHIEPVALPDTIASDITPGFEYIIKPANKRRMILAGL